jgi:hypothetical protein
LGTTNSIKLAGVEVPSKDITVFSGSTVRFIVPKILNGETNLNGRIEVKTDNGSFTGSTLFNYNPALKGVSSLSPGGATDTPVTQTAPSTPSPNNLTGTNANLQDTAPSPLIQTEKTSSELGNGILTVKVNTEPGVGVWKIDNAPRYNYRVDVIEIGPNNTVKRSTPSQGTNQTIEGFVSADGQTFSITRDEFIKEAFEQDIEMEEGNRMEISTTIELYARPDDREKYPQDFIRDYNFRIVVPSTGNTVQPEGSLVFIQRSEDVDLPNYNGKEYYNIKIPDGGYITYRFTCPRCVITKVEVVKSNEQTSVQNITITNTPDTKYTNVIDVKNSGRFVLSVTYNNADVPGTFTAKSEPFTL